MCKWIQANLAIFLPLVSREINIGWFQKVENANLTILEALHSDLLEKLHTLKYHKFKLQSCKNGQMALFDLLKSAKIDFT